MNVIGLCGYSGSGKTTLAERLIAQLRGAGQRVSVVKHAHHAFDIDHEGKDSWRHRQAGAFEVVIASDRRLAKMREFERRGDPGVHELIAELAPCDWVIVEGFKSAALPKIEVWRAATGAPARYPDDPWVVAIATDDAARLPAPSALPLLDLDDAAGVAAFLLRDPGRYRYRPPGEAPDRPLPPVVATAGAGADEPMPPGAARVGVLPLRGGAGAAGEARAAEELAVAIEVDGTCQGAMLTTPSDLEDLVLGHLLTEGVVDAAADLLGVEVVPVGAGIVLRATIAPACSERLKANPTRFASGLGGRSAAAWLDAAVRPVRRGGAVVEIEPAALARGMRELAAGQALWRATGANHAAAWVSLSGELLVVREDVGRRNAVDKLVGAMARAGTDPARGFIAVTSRVSGEMVHKVARAGVGLLAAISAPTAAAIRLAEESGMVLAGFARGDDATIYSHPERVRQDPAPRS